MVTLAVHAFRLPERSNASVPEPVVTAIAHPELIRAMFDGKRNTQDETKGAENAWN